jgi:hypothetical protein
LDVGRGDNPIPEKSTVTKNPEPMKESHGGGQHPRRIAGLVKKKRR